MIDDDGGGNFDLIGSIETSLGAIMGSKNQVYKAILKLEGKEKSRGEIIIRADSLHENNLDI